MVNWEWFLLCICKLNGENWFIKYPPFALLGVTESQKSKSGQKWGQHHVEITESGFLCENVVEVVEIMQQIPFFCVI